MFNKRHLFTLWRGLCLLQFLVLLIIFLFLSLTSSPGEHVPLYNDKLMHFSGYLVAGFSITFAFPGIPWWQRWLWLAVFSSGIEVAQHFMPPRTFSWLDILANVSGAATGLALCSLLRRLLPGWNRTLFEPQPGGGGP